LFEPLPFEEFEECDLDLSSLAGIADLRLWRKTHLSARVQAPLAKKLHSFGCHRRQSLPLVHLPLR
jgi:hypothetical protein